MDASDGSHSSAPTTKIDRVIREYGLDGLGDELERRWLSEEENRSSVRELTDLFNQRVLRAELEAQNVFSLGENVEHLYRSLVGETADGEDSTLIRARLEQNGVDTDALTDRFVSHQTVYRYLTEHRGVEQPEQPNEDRIERVEQTVQGLRGRTTAVTEQSLESLRSKGLVTLGEFEVLNDIKVFCEDCGRSYDVTELLERGRCACED
jgi:hypothetical protein